MLLRSASRKKRRRAADFPTWRGDSGSSRADRFALPPTGRAIGMDSNGRSKAERVVPEHASLETSPVEGSHRQPRRNHGVHGFGSW